MFTTKKLLIVITILVVLPVMVIAFSNGYSTYISRAMTPMLLGTTQGSGSPSIMACNRGLEKFSTIRACANQKSRGYRGARYTCKDGSWGNFETRTCLTYAELKNAANNSCNILARCNNRPTPKPTCIPFPDCYYSNPPCKMFPNVNYCPETITPTVITDGKFCGGIAGIQCPESYTCKLDGNYPDASGKCVLITVPPLDQSSTELPPIDLRQPEAY